MATFSIYEDKATGPSPYFKWTVEFEGVSGSKLAQRVSKAVGGAVLFPQDSQKPGSKYSCGHEASEHVFAALSGASFATSAPNAMMSSVREYYAAGSMPNVAALPAALPGAFGAPGMIEMMMFVQFNKHCSIVSLGETVPESYDPFFNGLKMLVPAKSGLLLDFETVAKSCD